MRLSVCSLVILSLISGCGTPQSEKAGGAPEPSSPTVTAETPATEPPEPEAIKRAFAPWKGDFDAMVERRLIRALVPYSRTNYFVDEKGRQSGASYDALMELENVINEQVGDKTRRVRILVVPVRRDQFLRYLEEGRADLALGNIVVTPERRSRNTFSAPVATGINEVIVTAKGEPPVATLDDLSGREVYVHKSTIYFEHLTALNADLAKRGKSPVKIMHVDEQLDDEDVLEMVNAGIYPATATKDFLAKTWAKVLPNIEVHDSAPLASGDEIAWVIRDDCPKFTETVNAFIDKHKVGTSFGNIVMSKYFGNAKWIKNATEEGEYKKLQDIAILFKKYAGEYDFDWLLVGAQAYQESGIDQSVRSPVGAVGIMQVLPSTAAGNPINITGIDVDADKNVHAGVKYMRFMMDEYFNDAKMDEINKHLFAFASYNAGPAKVARLRKEAEERGLDPNKWFENVELVAADRIGRETVTYVSNIYKYYVAYKMVVERKDALSKAKASARK